MRQEGWHTHSTTVCQPSLYPYTKIIHINTK